ncbi:ficolin-1-like [Drosophila navojoa]|uniref:ficolin-1-like n=1 Tax=Drosophila navojoa TaxID=7232 RepID=UPI000846C090|nr:ficolin-1-like [Drosophila navojoa]
MDASERTVGPSGPSRELTVAGFQWPSRKISPTVLNLQSILNNTPWCPAPMNVFDYAAEPGWIIFQNRYIGNENFYSSWADYRNGFGIPDGELFRGLEYIHRRTNDHRHELFVYVQGFGNEISWALYDNFVIGSEAESYRLKIVGCYRGAHDRLSQHVGNDFSTFDKENSPKNLSAMHHGGYWYFHEDAFGSNINGRYFKTEVDSNDGMYWISKASSKATRMMIRLRL